MKAKILALLALVALSTRWRSRRPVVIAGVALVVIPATANLPGSMQQSPQTRMRRIARRPISKLRPSMPAMS